MITLGHRRVVVLEIRRGELCVEQALPGQDRQATANMTEAAEHLRRGERSVMLASPSAISTVFAWLAHSGHVRM